MTIKASYDFSGSVVLITGGASGIGAAVARHCANGGATVIVADAHRQHVEQMTATRGIDARVVDVSNAEAVRALVADVVQRYGRIDAAVLAAAIQVRRPTDEIDDDEWRRHMAVNIDGVFYCVRELMPVMKRQREGALLAFTSGLATMGWPGAAAYASSKAAVVGLFKCVAQELKAFGVRANVISPGLVATPIFMDVSDQPERDMYERSVGISAPADVVPTILYLISAASANLTGAVIERRFALGAAPGSE